MIGARRKTRPSEISRYTLGRFLQRDVDDRRARVPRPEPFQEQGVPLLRAHRADREAQVRAIESSHKGAFTRDSEPRADIFHDGRRSCGRQGQDPFHAQRLCRFSKLQIVWTEIVPPFGNAVRFVYRKERDFHTLESFQKAFVVESLGSHVEQLECSGSQLAGDHARLLGRKRGIQPCRLDSPSRKEIDLVFHQSDQGRNDKGNTLKNQRWKLVAERLSTARRENGQRRVPGAQGIQNLLLTRAELRQTKLFLKQLLELR